MESLIINLFSQVLPLLVLLMYKFVQVVSIIVQKICKYIQYLRSQALACKIVLISIIKCIRWLYLRANTASVV
jgi:hypothetical protein